jgi:predicted flap endonuclease-1-like 5' DNA nuclease
MMQVNVFDAAMLGLIGQQDDTLGGIPWWVILVIALLVVLAGVIWFLVNENKEETEKQDEIAAATPPVEAQTVDAPAAAEAEPVAPAKPDDLTVVEGIGPKIAATLQAAGITTLAQLSEAAGDQIQQILDEAGLPKLADPGTWPEQARLAANGEWAALEKLQDALKGGRRVE